jgi:hypothetical protein
MAREMSLSGVGVDTERTNCKVFRPELKLEGRGQSVEPGKFLVFQHSPLSGT